MSQEVPSNSNASSSSSSSSSSQEEDDSFIPTPVVTRVVTLSATNNDTETTNHTNDNNNNNNNNTLTANPSSFVSSSSSSSVSSSVSSSAYPYEDGTLEMDTPSDTTPNTTTCIIEHSHPTTIGQDISNNNDVNNVINNNNNHHSLMELTQYSYMDNYVKMVFTILGVGMLLPWNAFVSADDYFETRLCSSNTDSDTDSGSNSNNGSGDGDGDGGEGIGEDENDKDDSSISSNGNFMLWMGLIYNLSNVLTLGILLYIQKQRRRRRAWKKHLSRTTTMMTATTTNTNTTAGGGGEGQEGQEEDFHMNDACSLHTTPIRVQDVLEVDAGMTLFQDDDDDDDDEAQQPRGNTTLTLQEIEIQKSQRQQRRMILLPFVIILVILTMTTIIVTISNISPFLFLLVTLVGTFLCGSSSAFISAGIVSFSSLFASHVGIQPFISGQALGGTLISILDMIFTAMTSHSIDPFWEEHCQQEGTVDSMDSSRETMMSPISSSTSSSSSFIISNQMSTSTLDGRILREDNDGMGCAEYLIDWGAFNYFAISTIFTVLCLYLYNNLDRQPQTNIRRAIANQGTDDDDDGIPTATTTTLQQQQQQEDQVESLEQMRRTALFGDESIWTSNWTSEEAEISGGSGGVTQHHFISNSASSGMGRSSSEESRSYQSINPPDGGGGGVVPTKHAMTMSDDDVGGGEVEEVVTNLTSFVWSRVRLPALSIFFVFFVTLSIFPAYWTTIQSVKQCQVKEDRWTNDLFVIMSIVFYNVADLAGRMCTSSVNTHTHRFPQKLLFWSVVRFLSFPLFLLCNTGGGGGSDGEDFLPLMNLFHTDLYSRILMLVFGFTNGFISSLAFTCAPALIPSKEEYQTVASTILNFALGIGLLGGSLFSFVYIRFASGDW